MRPAQIIAQLNALQVGDTETIEHRLEEARQACIGLQLGELALKLGEARVALHQADLKTYRKRVETVVARLGHLK
jgi:hypothetical protein